MKRWIPLLILVSSCASAPPPKATLPPGVEAISLQGKQLTSPALGGDVQAKREQDLAAAKADYDRNPNDADAIIWLGRRTAYLGRYREAITIFSEGIRKFPNDARMYRHRGHRYITVREFDSAISDLRKATDLTRNKGDEVEPDGLPNSRNIPTGSLQSNICYHLGLAHYLKGDFERALGVYRHCATDTSNPDRVVSVSHWLYMTLRRLGRPQEAERVIEPISSSMDVIEDLSYLKLLLMYRGEIAPEELLQETLKGPDRATVLYGIGNWYLYHGDTAKGSEIFRMILKSDEWPAFGYVAAESEVARQSPLR